MVAGKNEAVRSILRKGYNPTKGGGGHLWFEYRVDGERIALTFVSHGPDYDLDDYLLGEMGRGCHLTARQFWNFAKCHMTEKQYRQILVDKGVIKGD